MVQSRLWSDALVAWLHDPPDKALSIVDHVSRARRYASAALGDAVTESDIKILSDSLASASERLPMPAGKGDEAVDRRVGAEALMAIHPLSAAKRDIAALPVDADPIDACIRQIVAGLPGAERPQRFLALWRLLPERLAKMREEYAHLPADTRTGGPPVRRVFRTGANLGYHFGILRAFWRAFPLELANG